MRPGPEQRKPRSIEEFGKTNRFSEPDVLGLLHLKPHLGVLGLIQFNETAELPVS
jgi:hypothetical protein